MDSVQKSELLKFMKENGLTPRSKELIPKLEEFLLEKFQLRSYDLEDSASKRLTTAVKAFIKKLREITRKRSWNKVLILKSHGVRQF